LERSQGRMAPKTGTNTDDSCLKKMGNCLQSTTHTHTHTHTHTRTLIIEVIEREVQYQEIFVGLEKFRNHLR
jgi:hypothetical protein